MVHPVDWDLGELGNHKGRLLRQMGPGMRDLSSRIETFYLIQ
jgi:hypothetical protein